MKKYLNIIAFVLFAVYTNAQTIFPTNPNGLFTSTPNVSYTVTGGENNIDLTLAAGQTVTLPSAANFINKTLRFINNTTTNKAITSYTNSAGAASTLIPASSVLEIQSNGSAWKQINKNFEDAADKAFNGNVVIASTAGNTTTIGNTTGAITINSGTGAMNIGSDATTQTVNLATGTGSKTLTIGSTNTTSSSTIRGGTNGITLTSTATSNTGITLTSSNTSGSAIALTNSSLTSGVLLNLPSNSASKTSASRGIRVQFTGGLTNASQTIAAAEFSNTHTGTTQNNIALIATASGGTNNYAGLFTGNVGINTNTPANGLSVNSVLGFPATTLSNFATNTTLTASTSVNLTTSLNIPQTTVGIALTLPNPAVISETRSIIINNTGTANFTMNNALIAPGNSETFVWNSGTGAWNATSANKVLPSFRATRNATLSIPNITVTDVVWNATTDNTGSGLNTTTGVFTAPVAGLYFFRASLRMDYNATPVQESYLEINASGGQAVRGGFFLSGVQGNASSFYYGNCSDVFRLTAGETVKVTVKQDSGSAQNLTGTANLCTFSGYLVPDRY
jgi:C1q domain